MTLRRDPSCLEDLVWRVERLDTEALTAGLRAAGWEDRSRIPSLRDLHGPEGHAILIVPRTGRVQLRLHYLVRPSERRAAAEAVYGWLTERAAPRR